MLAFSDAVAAAIPVARRRNVSLKLSSLRDAISTALVNMPYSQAMFSERQGRSLAFSLTDPVHIHDSAEKFGISYSDLIGVLRDVAREQARSPFASDAPVYCAVGASATYGVDQNGEINRIGGERSSQVRPLFRIVLHADKAEHGHVYWWPGRPSIDAALQALRALFSTRALGSVLLMPKSTDSIFPGFTAAISQAFSIRVVHPTSLKQMGRSAVTASDQPMEWLLSKLWELGEGSLSLDELSAVTGNAPFPYCVDRRDLDALYQGEALADAVCRLRGRDPKVQKEKRKRLPSSAPQAIAGKLPERHLDAVDVATELLLTDSHFRRWQHPNSLRIVYLVKQWETADEANREKLQGEVGRLLLAERCDRPDSYGGTSSDDLFGSEHPYCDLMTRWATDAIVSGIEIEDGRTITAIGLKLTFSNAVGGGRWPKRIPLQDELSRLFEAEGWGAAEFSDYIHGRFDSNETYGHQALIELAAQVITNYQRWPTTQTGKQRYLSQSGEVVPFCGSEPVVLVNGDSVRGALPDLAPWVEKVNVALSSWGAGCRLESASLNDPRGWPTPPHL